MGLSVSRRGSAAASRSGTSRSGARRAMLDFRGRKDAGMDEVLDAVDDSAPGVTVLLGDMGLTSESIRELCEFMRRRPDAISRLSLHSNVLHAADVIRLSHHLRGLVSLDLDRVSLGETGLSALGRALRQAANLRKLTLNDNRDYLSRATFCTFIDGVRLSGLTCLELNDNLIPDEEMCEIARRLNGACLEMLSLSGNRIKASGTRALAQTLSSASSRIQFLDLSRNRITADGAAALASMLVQNCVLTELDVNANPITDVGLERISEALEANSTLTMLRLPFAEAGSASDTLFKRIRHLLDRSGTPLTHPTYIGWADAFRQGVYQTRSNSPVHGG
ncbi:Leucine-rich repeat-containing protein [Plasmodiophora brassicae]